MFIHLESKRNFDSGGSPRAQMETKMTNESLPMKDTLPKGLKDPGQVGALVCSSWEVPALPWADWDHMAASLLSDSLIMGSTHRLLEGFLQAPCVAVS